MKWIRFSLDCPPSGRTVYHAPPDPEQPSIVSLDRQHLHHPIFSQFVDDQVLLSIPGQIRAGRYEGKRAGKGLLPEQLSIRALKNGDIAVKEPSFADFRR